MYLISAIPLTFVPRQEAQVFTYFFSERLKRGQLAEAPIGNRSAKVLVLASEDVEKRKAELRTASFKLKGIENVFNENTVVSEGDLELYKWIAQYYFSPLGFVVRTALPAYLLERPDLDYSVPDVREGSGFSFSYSQSPLRFGQYVKTVEKNAQSERQTLVLFPEVISAEQFYRRLSSELQEDAVLWTSGMTPKQEYTARKRLLNNELKTVIGTRSASLLSLPWLKSIIVESEENDAHVSWDQHPKYDARRIALWRAKKYSLSLFFGSPIPSVMLYKRAQDMRTKIEFRSRKKSDPSTHIIDMREESKTENIRHFSLKLQDEISHLRSSQQGLLLINRRGEYTVVLCRDCGYALRCSQCDTALITMSDTDNLVCRECGIRHPLPGECLDCGGTRLRPFGAGTQRIADEVSQQFPTLRVGRLDSDSAATVSAQRSIIDRFNGGKLDVLVGTQMMVKPRLLGPVHLAAVVSLETSLLLPEYNGTEQAYLLASKLRLMARDTFIWQTYRPEDDIFDYFKDLTPERFLKDALTRRDRFRWPPMTQLVTLTIRTKSKKDASEKAHILGKQLEKVLPQGVTLFDPLPAHTERIKGRYVWEILLKMEPSLSLKKRNAFLSYVPSRWEVTVDPISTLN